MGKQLSLSTMHNLRTKNWCENFSRLELRKRKRERRKKERKTLY
jgi:hypothetical protein